MADEPAIKVRGWPELADGTAHLARNIDAETHSRLSAFSGSPRPVMTCEPPPNAATAASGPGSAESAA